MGYAVLLIKNTENDFTEFAYWMFDAGSNVKGGSGDSKNGDEDEEEVLDEETLRRDQAVKGAVDVLIREYASELNAPSHDPDSQPRKKRKEKKEEVRAAKSEAFRSLFLVYL